MSVDYEFPWERSAMRGDEMPDGLDLADQMAYTSLRHIYGLYRQKLLSRDQAAAEKMRLRRQWQQAKDTLGFADRSAQFRARVLKETEAAATACRKNPTPENALRLCDVIAGLHLPVEENGNG